MGTAGVKFLLSDGPTVVLGDEERRRIYEVLWDMEGEPGAVTTAAIVLSAKSEARFSGGEVKLPPRESKAFRRAMSRIAAVS